MKSCLFAAFVLIGCVSIAAGELSEKDLKRLKDTQVGSIRVSTEKNDSKQKFEVVEANTFQNQDRTETFRIHIVAEVTDKTKKTWLIDIKANQPEDRDPEYLGENYWRLWIPHGDLERVKISALAVEYGVMDGENFVVLNSRFDKVKSVEQLTARTTTPFEGDVRLKYTYMYEDPTDGTVESISQTLRTIK